jgi:hypothetical protein
MEDVTLSEAKGPKLKLSPGPLRPLILASSVLSVFSVFSAT